MIPRRRKGGRGTGGPALCRGRYIEANLEDVDKLPKEGHENVLILKFTIPLKEITS